MHDDCDGVVHRKKRKCMPSFCVSDCKYNREKTFNLAHVCVWFEYKAQQSAMMMMTVGCFVFIRHTWMGFIERTATSRLLRSNCVNTIAVMSNYLWSMLWYGLMLCVFVGHWASSLSARDRIDWCEWFWRVSQMQRTLWLYFLSCGGCQVITRDNGSTPLLLNVTHHHSLGKEWHNK